MPSMIRLALAISALFALAAPASAQVPCASDEPRVTDEAILAEARHHFVEGTVAAEEGRWLDALRGFEAAYAMSRLPAALFNSARALEEVGRLRAARTAYDCVLGSPMGIPEDQQGAIRSRRDALDERIPRLLVEALPPRDEIEIEVDGVEIDDGRRPLIVVLDPGEHSLRASRGAGGLFRWRGSLSETDRVTLRARFQSLDVSSGPEPRRDGTWLEEPWFWVVTGAVMAGVAVTVIAIESGGGLDPRTDITHEL